MRLRPDLVEPQDGLNALVQKVSLPEQTAPVKSHQLLVEVHSEDVEVEPTLHAFGFPQGHRAQRASFERERTRDNVTGQCFQLKSPLSLVSHTYLA